MDGGNYLKNYFDGVTGAKKFLIMCLALNALIFIMGHIYQIPN